MIKINLHLQRLFGVNISAQILAARDAFLFPKPQIKWPLNSKDFCLVEISILMVFQNSTKQKYPKSNGHSTFAPQNKHHKTFSPTKRHLENQLRHSHSINLKPLETAIQLPEKMVLEPLVGGFNPSEKY